MFSVLLVLLIIVAIFMTGLILLQKSEGSGMSGSAAAAMFGGALTGAAAGNFLTKLTAWLAVLFFVLCAALALVSSKTSTKPDQTELHQELNQLEVTGAQTASDQVNTNKPVEPVQVDTKTKK